MDVNELVPKNANKCRVLFYRPLHTTGDVNLSLSFSWNLHLRLPCGNTKKNLQNWYYVVKTCPQLRFGILNTKDPQKTDMISWAPSLLASSTQFLDLVFTMRFTVGLIKASFKLKFLHTFKCAYSDWLKVILWIAATVCSMMPTTVCLMYTGLRKCYLIPEFTANLFDYISRWIWFQKKLSTKCRMLLETSLRWCEL